MMSLLDSFLKIRELQQKDEQADLNTIGQAAINLVALQRQAQEGALNTRRAE